MDSLLKFDNITFSYPAQDAEPAKVLNGVSLSVNPGELVAVVGHNGSGKSTLAKMTNAMLVPDSGRVTVSGMDTRDGDSLLKIRQTVGMVFQNPDNQIVATVVEEDVAFALENLGVPPAEIRQRVDWALKTVRMSEYAMHAPHRLSGGQKQRVAIAGVIAMRPRCIVLDEPTAMLDPFGRQEVMSTILRLNREQGITILLITHHMNEAARCGRIVVMNDGAVSLDGTPREVFRQYETIRGFGLAVPQPFELAHQLGLDGTEALTVDECTQSIYKWLGN